MNCRTLFFENYSKYRSALMGVAMLSIMFSHQRFVHVFPFNIFESYGHWGVDIFLFLSGMGMVSSLASRSIKSFYHRRFMRLAPICIFCGTLKYLVFLSLGEPVRNLEVGLNLGVWSVFSLDLWFIHSIIIYYLMSPLLYKLLRTFPGISMLLAYFISIVMQYVFAEQVGYDWLNPLGIMLYTIERLPVFMIGMMISMYKDQIKEVHFKNSTCAIFATLVLALLLKTHVISYHLQALIYPLLSLGMLAVIGILIAGFLHLPKKLSTIFDDVGGHSLEIYLVHEFVFAAFLLTMYTVVDHFLLFIAAFALSIFIARCCSWCTDKIMQSFHYTH